MATAALCLLHYVKNVCNVRPVNIYHCFKRTICTTIIQFQKKTSRDVDDRSERNDIVSVNNHSDVADFSKPLFPEIVHDDMPIAEKGLKLRESAWLAAGRFIRMFTSVERYNKWWDDVTGMKIFAEKRLNWFNENLYRADGAEWNLCYLILRIGGAFKLVTDDRWIDEVNRIRTPSKKDCTVQAVDLRNSALNYSGMKYFNEAGFIRFLNVADSVLFDDSCLTLCHSLAHSLEYLDISGTAVTPGGFSILRIFPHLRWLNISRLQNPEQVEALLPFLQEILPRDCVVVWNDQVLAQNYGCKIPYRGKDPSKDVLLEENPGIGDVNAFLVKYKFNALEVNDTSVIHKLWQTPVISKRRRYLLKAIHPNNNPTFFKVIDYVCKGEKSRPLF